MGMIDKAPEPFGIGTEGSYGWAVFHERHPKLVETLLTTLPLGPSQRESLQSLLDESRHGTVHEAAHGPQRGDWQLWGADYYGRPWRDVPFLWAESFFFRRLLGAVGHFTPGPWLGFDPFALLKAAELDSVKALDDPPREASYETFQTLLLASVHGNQADLAFAFSNEGESRTGKDPALVADDSPQIWSQLVDNAPASVHFVLDNSGRELSADLILAWHLLVTDLASEVVLHVKPSPYFVSDAVSGDVRDALGRLGVVGVELLEASVTGKFRVYTHPFHCAPLEFRELPASLASALPKAGLTLFKGDLNYRRLVGDRPWDPTTPFASLVDYLPGPAAALRMLKSEAVVGLEPAVVEKLNASGEDWRTDGTHAVVQFSRPSRAGG